MENISKSNDYWFRVALTICKNKTLAKDLVQDMYLKIYDISQKKETDINKQYICRVIHNLFINHCKKENKTIKGINFDLIDSYNKYEINDKENEILKKLTFLERELLLIYHTDKMSYHDIEKEYNINYQFARRKIIGVRQKYGTKKKK